MADESYILIQRISDGDQIAFKELYDVFSARVYNTLLSYTQNEEDAEELLQDVFVKVFHEAVKFRNDSSVSTWIYRIAVNRALDFKRNQQATKRKGFFFSLYKKDSGDIQYDQTDFVHPGVQMENKEDAKQLFKVIETLPENQKTAFILTQIEGLNQTDAGEIMQVSRKAVESLLKRAKENLKKTLIHLYPERGIN
ncbi:RNA polymerase sigma-70 factor (ECF subfamily) [Algoriphagus ratkowskyi]|uniref:RNA polymerase sigma factor n=1 Tax=Algoriphagus ratkowskyi TaxID=57028 RepID=A0A2W7RLA5_9BACT|nr:RNA polymerase sigma factor [Algoriphagus ratkowskyi]PZX61174.1 RNA polymerase sigma-70 factor (ECF subfamily) [Algoriphagus ratkowskyi]TXD79298.1 RNA polymerase sigma factor [Algoriphagus ratkowskyi]